MEQVVDKIVAELELFVAAPYVDPGNPSNTAAPYGGAYGLLEIEAVYWGDIGVIPVNAYPCFIVQPVKDTPTIETTAYEVRALEILITLLIDARAYFDASTIEASGDRKMVEIMERVRQWFRRDHNRSLGGGIGVREVKVTTAEYNAQVRGGVIAKAAQVTLLVDQQKFRQK